MLFSNLAEHYMNPYEKKRRWKLFLLVFAMVIGTASVFYTDFFVKKMEREERIQFELWVKGTEKSSQIFDDALIPGRAEYDYRQQLLFR